MHERERHRIIIGTVQAKPVATIQELVEMTGSSEATIRRDISALHVQKKLRRIRGGAEAINPTQYVGLAGRPFKFNEAVNADKKRAIARAAVELCADGDDIIINGGTTTFQMVPMLTDRRLQVITNSFPIAEHLLKHSKSTVMVPGGTIYREQNIILSPFEDDVVKNFHAHRMFMGAQGISRLGVLEPDPLLIRAVRKLMDQADEIVVLADSSKFDLRSIMVLSPFDRITTLITDDGISEESQAMVEAAGVQLTVVKTDSLPSRAVAG